MPIHKYDLALSFSGSDREIVEACAEQLRSHGYNIFYDTWHQSSLWGKDLYQYLDVVYRIQARYCIVFISTSYIQRAWCTHELQSAQARAFSESAEYILPVKLDDVAVPGLLPTIGYLDFLSLGLSGVVDAVKDKLGQPVNRRTLQAQLDDLDDEVRCRAISYLSLNADFAYSKKLQHLMLSDDSSIVRARAAWALDNFQDIDALPALIDALNDAVWEVRSNAGWGLVHLGKAARPALEDLAIRTVRREVHEMIALILERMR